MYFKFFFLVKARNTNNLLSPLPGLERRCLGKFDDGNTVEITHINGLQESLGIGIDFDVVHINDRNSWHVVIASFAFFFLQFEGNATDGTLLNAAHQVSDVACDLVTKTLGRNDSNLSAYTLINLKIEGQARVVFFNDGARRSLDSLCANTL